VLASKEVDMFRPIDYGPASLKQGQIAKWRLHRTQSGAGGGKPATRGCTVRIDPS